MDVTNVVWFSGMASILSFLYDVKGSLIHQRDLITPKLGRREGFYKLELNFIFVIQMQAAQRLIRICLNFCVTCSKRKDEECSWACEIQLPLLRL